MPITTVLNHALKEGFANNNGGNNAGNNNNTLSQRKPNMLVVLVMLVIYFILVLLVGKYLWNECLCKVVTICKPVNNVFTLLGVILIIDMLHPRL